MSNVPVTVRKPRLTRWLGMWRCTAGRFHGHGTTVAIAYRMWCESVERAMGRA